MGIKLEILGETARVEYVSSELLVCAEIRLDRRTMTPALPRLFRLYFKNLYELAAYLSGVMNVQSTYCYTSYLLPLHHIELPAPDMSNTRPPTLST